MNTEYLKNNVDRLESVFLNMIYMTPDERIIAPDMSILDDIKVAINNIFDENSCINVIYTQNTDKQFFGVKINPAMSPSDAVVILSTDEPIRLNKYQIEFDSKLFEIGLNKSELAAIVIYEISEMMDNNNIFEKVRASIDSRAVNEDDIISIKDSVNYSQLIIFAIKDTMYKYSSIIFKNNSEDLLTNPSIQACNYQDDILSANEKITGSINGLSDSLREDSPVILQWMFTMIKDIKHCTGIITDVLKDAKVFTASKLEIAEINKTISAIEHIDMSLVESMSNMDLNKFFEAKNLSALNEISIFKNLKKNGLRGLENELYEYAMRVKNCTTSEDAYLIMRGINSRIGILEDYISNEDLSQYDLNHWTNVANRYRELRSILASKKFKEKNYGLWYDYNKLEEEY